MSETPPPAAMPAVTLPAVDPAPTPLAIGSLAAGIAGFIFLPVLGSLIAVILGHMARAAVKRDPQTVGGKGMATVGLVLGYIGLSVVALIVAIIVLAVVTGALILTQHS